MIAAGGLAVLAAALPIPAGLYKGEIERSVTRTTGRKFTISGPLSFTLFPIPGIRADNVTLANMAGGYAPAMATAEDIRVAMRLMPLLTGRIEVSEIVLDKPRIALEVDAHGRANWTFDREHGATDGGTAPLSSKTNFSGLRIDHGTITYTNARTGSAHVLDDLDAAITTTDPERPATIGGSFALSGRRVAFHAKVATPRALLQDRQATLDLSLDSGILRASFDGMVAPDGNAQGRVKLDTPSIRRIGAWLGASLPSSGGLGPLSLEAQFHDDNHVALLSDLKLALDGMAIAGGLSLDRSGDVPAAKGALTVDRLDLNPYIENPNKHGATHPHHDEAWSDDPIALDILRKANADLVLNVGSLIVRKLHLGRTQIKVRLDGGRLSAALAPMTLYGGTGKAQLDVDARGAVPAFRNALEFDGVALQPFFSDTIGVHQIEGTGTIRLDLASRGASPDAVMRALSGAGSIAFRDGRLRGVDLGAVARTIQRALGAAADPDAFTRYSEMGGSFTVADGVLANRDFHLTGPVLRMTGIGSVDVGNRAIDFRIAPQATASLADHNLTFGIPFRIKGPWRHVHYIPDVAGIVKGVIANLEAGRAPFKGMFGGSSNPDTPKKKHKSIGDALKNMLGIH